MQKQKILVFVFLLILFNNCRRGGPCDNAGPINCVGIYYGSTKLNDSSSSWLPVITAQTINFSAGTGSTLNTFSFVHRNRMVYKDILLSYTEQRTCGTAYCENYCNSENESILYETTTGNFSIELKREKDYYEYLDNLSTDKVQNSKDRLIVNLKSLTDTSIICFKVLLNQKSSSNGDRFYDSLNLGNRRHFNVYECYQDRVNQTGVYVKGIYYTTDNGLVGYYFNNNQVWYVQ